MRFEFPGLGNACVFDLTENLERREKNATFSPSFLLFLFLTAFHSISTATTAPDPSETERRITEAADAARAEGEAGLEDLLVCLGEVKSAYTRFVHPFAPLFELTITALHSMTYSTGRAQGRGPVGQARGAGSGRCSAFSRVDF